MVLFVTQLTRTLNFFVFVIYVYWCQLFHLFYSFENNKFNQTKFVIFLFWKANFLFYF